MSAISVRKDMNRPIGDWVNQIACVLATASSLLVSGCQLKDRILTRYSRGELCDLSSANVSSSFKARHFSLYSDKLDLETGKVAEVDGLNLA